MDCKKFMDQNGDKLFVTSLDDLDEYEAGKDARETGRAKTVAPVRVEKVFRVARGTYLRLVAQAKEQGVTVNRLIGQIVEAYYE